MSGDNRTIRKVISIAATIFYCASLPVVAQSHRVESSFDSEYTFEQRLSRLVDVLERKRREHHIPGMALVVVKDDEVVLTHGFGWADIANRRPVTPETIFAIGSATKSFSSTLIAMLVDEGRMSWDDPITRHLPYFQLNPKGAEAGEVVTVRDLLCHRTGYMRMNLLWLNENISSREEVLRLATRSEPLFDFRERFNYTNVGFLAVGEASARAGGMAWDSMIGERIFEPLGMSGSNTSVRISREDPRAATGYAWEPYSRFSKPLALRNIDLIGAAGTVNSNVQDMAQWLRFHLQKGEFDRERLLSEANHQVMWNPQFPLGEDNHYGLGWFVRRWKDHLQVDHGGAVDGFHAQMAMLPDAQLGFVLLTNLQSNPLIGESIELVWETLVGDKPSLPTVEEVLRLRGVDDIRAILESMGTYRMTGKVRRHQSGADGEFTWVVSGNDHHYREQDYGLLGQVRLAVNPENAAMSNTTFVYQELRGRFYEQSVLQHPAAIFGDWSDFFDVIEVIEETERNGRRVYSMRMVRDQVPPYTAYVDVETGDLVQLETRLMRPASAVSSPETFTYEDYREFRGLRVPFKISSRSSYHGITEFQLEEIDTNLDIERGVFILTRENDE